MRAPHSLVQLVGRGRSISGVRPLVAWRGKDRGQIIRVLPMLLVGFAQDLGQLRGSAVTLNCNRPGYSPIRVSQWLCSLEDPEHGFQDRTSFVGARQSSRPTLNGFCLQIRGRPTVATVTSDSLIFRRTTEKRMSMGTLKQVVSASGPSAQRPGDAGEGATSWVRPAEWPRCAAPIFA